MINRRIIRTLQLPKHLLIVVDQMQNRTRMSVQTIQRHKNQCRPPIRSNLSLSGCGQDQQMRIQGIMRGSRSKVKKMQSRKRKIKKRKMLMTNLLRRSLTTRILVMRITHQLKSESLILNRKLRARRMRIIHKQSSETRNQTKK